MKKSLLLVAALFLLVGCSSKKDICARAAAEQITPEEAAQKLGLKRDTEWGNFWTYCEFYKN